MGKRRKEQASPETQALDHLKTDTVTGDPFSSLFAGLGSDAPVSIFSSNNPFRRSSSSHAEEQPKADTVSEPERREASKKRRRSCDKEDVIHQELECKSKRKKEISNTEKFDALNSNKELGLKNATKLLESQKEKRKREFVESDKRKTMLDSREKLERTIFVGNLPVEIKKKALIRMFKEFGDIESARLRSVPLGDTKMSRKAAIITGHISEVRKSQNGYIVFKDQESTRKALAHNMCEFGGKHIRVDLAQAPSVCKKGNSSLSYDSTRSIFVGNLPFDAEEEELYTLFSQCDTSGQGVEAIRVVRDRKNNIGKGIAFVMFKSKVGVKDALSKRNLTLRDRVLRVKRIASSDTSSKTVGSWRERLQGKRDTGKASFEGTRSSAKGKKNLARKIGDKKTDSSNAAQPFEGTRAIGKGQHNLSRKIGDKKSNSSTAAQPRAAPKRTGSQRKSKDKRQ